MSMHPTAAEAAIEPAIAALGEPYRFQYPFLGIKYFADFALLDRKLIIEVDGYSHLSLAQREKDLIHEIQALELGWRVVRVSNADATECPEDSVAWAIRQTTSPVEELKARLAQLHQDYPELLAAAAKKATHRSRSAKAGAAARRRQPSPGPSRASRLRARKQAEEQVQESKLGSVPKTSPGTPKQAGRRN